MSKLDKEATQVLQDLLENLGEASGVLVGLHGYLELLEQRYQKVIKHVGKGAMIVVVGLLIMIGFNAISLREARKVTSANKVLIDRLKVVADEAQRKGARTDIRQCVQIESLKTVIRTVLVDSKAPEEFVNRFKEHTCKDLPNAKIVKP